MTWLGEMTAEERNAELWADTASESELSSAIVDAIRDAEQHAARKAREEMSAKIIDFLAAIRALP